MIEEKYAELGFEITKFGASSKVLRFNHRPIFVFNPQTNIDVNFMSHICETYLKIYQRTGPMSLKVG